MISRVMIGDVPSGEFLINHCNFNITTLFKQKINKITLFDQKN